jgi:cysteine desulfurase
MTAQFLNFDANATYGVIPEVQEAAARLGRDVLNPNSVHQGGQRARALVEEAREAIGALLKLPKPVKIIFTSGATEANNMALMSPYWDTLSARREKISFASLAVEHPSVLEVGRRLTALGLSHEILDTHRGSLEEEMSRKIGAGTLLLSAMLANNETGEIFPIAEISKRARILNPKILVHTDAVQALGKVDLSWEKLGVDALSISSHKIGGLPGAGALVVDPRFGINSLLLGGPQEMHLRAGTENVTGIHAFGIAARVLIREQDARLAKMLRQRSFMKEILKRVPGISIITGDRPVLPNTLSLFIRGIRADDLVVAMDLEGIAISSGAACASGKPEPSHVLLAMGLSPEDARSTIRISLTGDLSNEAVERATSVLIRCISQIRKGGARNEEFAALS